MDISSPHHADVVRRQALDRLTRRQRCVTATLFAVAMIGALIVGSSVQQAVGLGDLHGWGQQIAVVAVGVLFIASRRPTRDEARLTWSSRPGTGRALLWTALIAGCLSVGYGLVIAPFQPLSAPSEELLYEATAPGVAEELAFRGVMLGLLRPVFTRGVSLGGVTLTAAHLLPAVPFALLHLTGGGSPVEILMSITVNVIASVAFAWLVERSGALWPAIAAHNVANVALSCVIDRF
ncbi:MAG: lysostaphin resistance A-like protein [Dermatophilaceae bacterium]